ncbi:MAG: hypothetical protein MJ106_05900 [Lentisphaeria bacterium]|nr:hypothetical protein [Lentisphaeria bacterium]
MENGQSADVTLSIHGKGKAQVSLAWYDARGAFVCNSNKQFDFELSEAAETKSFVFDGEATAFGKGGAYFRLNVFLLPPGGDITVEAAEVTTSLP